MKPKITIHDYLEEPIPVKGHKSYRVELDDRGLEFIEARWDPKMGWLEIYASNSITVFPMVSNRVGIQLKEW